MSNISKRKKKWDVFRPDETPNEINAWVQTFVNDWTNSYQNSLKQRAASVAKMKTTNIENEKELTTAACNLTKHHEEFVSLQKQWQKWCKLVRAPKNTDINTFQHHSIEWVQRWLKEWCCTIQKMNNYIERFRDIVKTII